MQVTRARAARSLQMSVGASGASLAVNTEGKLYSFYFSTNSLSSFPVSSSAEQSSLPG